MTLDALIWNDKLFIINTAPPKALLQWPYLDSSTYNGLTYNDF